MLPFQRGGHAALLGVSKASPAVVPRCEYGELYTGGVGLSLAPTSLSGRQGRPASRHAAEAWLLDTRADAASPYRLHAQGRVG